MDLVLTYRCQNDCPHCYVSRPKGFPEITTERWKRAIDRCWELGIPHVTFTGGYTPLRPRQELTASPYALCSTAAPWSGLAGVPATFVDGADNDTTYSTGLGLNLAYTTFSADTTYLQRRVDTPCGSGYAIRAIAEDGTVTCEAVGGGGGGWSLTGNAGTVPGTNHLGTRDNVALEIQVNGGRALRLEPTNYGPNLIAGGSANQVTTGVKAGTIGGGGSSDSPNRVTDTAGTVSGGSNNRAGDNAGGASDAACATVGGGYGNTAGGSGATAGGSGATAGGGSFNEAGSASAVIGGGSHNEITANDATVGGGTYNRAAGAHTTVAGGWANHADGFAATVPGGEASHAVGDYSLAAGRRAPGRVRSGQALLTVTVG